MKTVAPMTAPYSVPIPPMTVIKRMSSITSSDRTAPGPTYFNHTAFSAPASVAKPAETQNADARNSATG